MNTFKKLTGFLAVAFLIGSGCDPEEKVYVDEFGLISSKWKLEDSNGECTDGPGNPPSDGTMIFRPDGEFIARGYGQEASGSWSTSHGTIRINNVNYSVIEYTGAKLTLQNKGCIATYIATGLDEIYNQGAFSISQHSATLKGMVESNLTEDLKIVIEYGYTMHYEETIEMIDNITSVGYPPIYVSGEITGLAPGTRYHYRLKAIGLSTGNEFYGPPMTFQTFNEVQLEDVDGNVYNTVTVDNRVWMAENLRVTHLRDGTLIPTVSNQNAIWSTLSEPAMAFNTVESCGALYNGYAVQTEQLCPTGWHVATSPEWRAMLYFLGEKSIYKLMEASSEYWLEPYVFRASNETGFSALGCLNKSQTTFWTGTSSNPLIADYFMIDIYIGDVEHNSSQVYAGKCVRCIRD